MIRKQNLKTIFLAVLIILGIVIFAGAGHAKDKDRQDMNALADQHPHQRSFREYLQLQ